MNVNCIIGIDPGKQGGIAVWVDGMNTKTIRMPDDLGRLAEMLDYYRANYNPLVVLEKLSVRPDDVAREENGVNLGKLYRIQKMVENFAQLKVVVELSGIPFVLVHPMKWQSALGLRLKGVKEEKPERKRRYKEGAARLYPEVKVTMWNADALLLVSFGKYALSGDVKWLKANLPARAWEGIF